MYYLVNQKMFLEAKLHRRDMVLSFISLILYSLMTDMLAGSILSPSKLMCVCFRFASLSISAENLLCLIFLLIIGRSDALGKIGISYGLGMIVGPFIGGLITERFDEQSAALAAAFGSLLSVLLVFVFIPSNTKAFQAHDSEEKEKIGKIHDLV